MYQPSLEKSSPQIQHGAKFDEGDSYKRSRIENYAKIANDGIQESLVQLQSLANGNGVESAPSQGRGGLPGPLKSGIESLSGISMADVRVHYNSRKPAQLQAHAYAQGSEIHLAPGQEKHLPHEAWHVVQQKQGRVKPTLQLKGVAINDDSALEREADVMGDRALLGTTETMQRKLDLGFSPAKVSLIQRKLIFDENVQYLNPSHEKNLPGLFTLVMARADALPITIRVHSGLGVDAKSRAFYQFDQKANEGVIQVADRKYADNADAKVIEQEINGIMIAMIHETQHALDDLENGSPLKDKITTRSGTLADWVPKIMSELNAHATQAALTRSMIAVGKLVPQTDQLLAESFEEAQFRDERGAMFQKLILYFTQYGAPLNRKQDKNDPEMKNRSDDELRKNKVSDFVFLNWGEIRDIVKKSKESPHIIGK